MEVELQPDPTLLKYRNQFCRICLENCHDSLIPMDAQVKNITLLEMFIQMTTLELENNDAFPISMCEQCVSKLALAYSIRQEFIYQTEYLLKLVVDDQILSFYKKYTPAGLIKEENAVPIVVKRSTKTPKSDKTSPEAVGLLAKATFSRSVAHQLANDSSEHSAAEVKDEPSETMETSVDATSVNSPDAHGLEKSSFIVDNSVDSMSDESNDSWDYSMNSVIPSNQPLASIPKVPSIPRKKHNVKPRNKPRVEKKPLDQNGVSRNQYSTTKCYICDLKLETIELRDDHFRNHIHMIPYVCGECINDDVQDDATDAPEAGKPIVLRSVIQVNSHLMMHQMPHKCMFCYRRFTTTGLLHHHLWNYHEHAKDGLTCEWCGKRYFRRRPFQEHIRRHKNSEGQRFKCPTCERTFGSNALLKRHILVHTGEKNHKCTYCSRLFNRRCNLLDHLRLHTGERCHKCSECDQAFNTNVALLKHRQVHHMIPSEAQWNVRRLDRNIYTLQDDGTKLFRCKHEGCEFTSTVSTTMTTHRLRHGNSPYVCDECGQRFVLQRSVLRHKAYMHAGKQRRRVTRSDRTTADERKPQRRIQPVKEDDAAENVKTGLLRTEFPEGEDMNVVREYVVEFVEDSNTFEA